MVGKTFATIKQEVGAMIMRDTAWAPAFLDSFVNEAYKEVCRMFRFDFLERNKYITVPAAYTTGTVSVTIGATTVTGVGTTWTQAMVRQYIVMGGQAYEISAVTDTTTLIIARAYEGSANLSGSSYTITYCVVNLPWGVTYSGVKKLRNLKVGSNLAKKDRNTFIRDIPNPTMTGDPSIWTPLHNTGDTYGTFAAAATTNTTTVVAPLGTATLNDYYLDWTLHNQTRSAMSRVTAYVGGTTRTFTVSPAITSQAAADVVMLFDDRRRLFLYPFPVNAFSLHLTATALPEALVASTDVPTAIPMEWHDVLVYGTAYKCAQSLDSVTKKQIIEAKFHSILASMMSEYGAHIEDGYRREAFDSTDLVTGWELYAPTTPVEG